MVVSRVVEHGRRAIMQYDKSQFRPRGENPLVKHPDGTTKLPYCVKCSAQDRYDVMIETDKVITWIIQTGRNTQST